MPKNFQLPEDPPDRLGKSFWMFVHNLLRHGEDDLDRAGKAISMFMRDLGPIAKNLCGNEQAEVLGLILRAFQGGQVAPSWAIIRDQMSSKATLQDYVEEYENLAGNLPILEALDLPAVLDKWQIQRKKVLARAALKLAGEVGAGVVKVEDHHGRTVPLTGYETALDLVAEVRDELFRDGQAKSSSVVIGDHKSRSIIRDETLGMNQRKVIPTGFPGLDEVLTLSRSQLVGILAGPGVGKTRLSRSIAYNMATQGFKVLHVQLETHETSEVNYYSLIHASSRPDWAEQARYFGLTFEQLNRGKASAESTSWLTEVVLKDFQDSLPGSVTILSPKDNTWGTIREEIDHLSQGENPFDVVMIDYLTLVENGSDRNKDARVMEAISSATRWAQQTGTLVISPVQGRRDAAAEAKDENGGLWDLSGIYKYSDYDRHLTACISLTVMDNGEVNLGLPKNRWGSPLWRPVVCRVNHACGYIYQPRPETPVPECLDDVYEVI